jgi:hypothetical protein
MAETCEINRRSTIRNITHIWGYLFRQDISTGPQTVDNSGKTVDKLPRLWTIAIFFLKMFLEKPTNDHHIWGVINGQNQDIEKA